VHVDHRPTTVGIQRGNAGAQKVPISAECLDKILWRTASIIANPPKRRDAVNQQPNQVTLLQRVGTGPRARNVRRRVIGGRRL